MIIVVDANILFSALITPAGRIADIITHPISQARFITCHYAFWTGDKKLTEHLKLMKFDRVLNTTELYELLKLG